MRRLFMAAALCFTTLLLCTSVFAQETKSNPFIDDGRMTDSPFEFDFEVTSVKNEVDRHNRPLLLISADIDHEELVERLKKAYKRRETISNHFNVMGYAWQTQAGEWSFQLLDKTTNTHVRISVVEDPGGSGALIRVYAHRQGRVLARYRRVWSGFSPRGLDKYSIRVAAH